VTDSSQTPTHLQLVPRKTTTAKPCQIPCLSLGGLHLQYPCESNHRELHKSSIFETNLNTTHFNMLIQVSRMTEADIDGAIDTIQQAFAEDPYNKWIYPDRSKVPPT
jgi:hypothetical protein